jgi:hypothetical protein
VTKEKAVLQTPPKIGVTKRKALFGRQGKEFRCANQIFGNAMTGFQTAREIILSVCIALFGREGKEFPYTT